MGGVRITLVNATRTTVVLLTGFVLFPPTALAQSSGGSPTTVVVQGDQVFVQGPLPQGSGAQGPVTLGSPLLPRRDMTIKTGTARVRGTVRAAESGAPLRKASVQISSPEGGMRTVQADANGAFDFTELAAGRYRIHASKVGYIQMSFGQRRPEGGGRPLVVAEGAQIERVDLALPRGGVVTGRVVDEFGEPAPEVNVVAQRRLSTGQGGDVRLVPVGRSVMTNDAGEFRLFGLPPGEFVLAASQVMGGGGPFQQAPREGYAPTYFPGVADVNSAQHVRVRVAETLSDVTIPLVATTLARLSGTVVDGSGQPITQGVVMSVPRLGLSAGMPVRPGPIGADGSFTISGVPPGQYTLRANVPNDSRRTSTALVADVDVTGDDISGIRVAPAIPGKVTGSVVFTGTARPPASLEAIHILSVPAGPYLGSPPPPTPLRTDGSFEIDVPPGRVRLQARVPPSQGQAPWSVKSVFAGGTDVTDDGLEVRSGSDIRDVVIELTNVRSDLSGFVSDARGNRLDDYSVVVFARDRVRWKGLGRYVSVARPDETGRFRVNSLQPEDYEAVALEFVEMNRVQEPEFLETLRGAGVTFTLGEGETRVLDLRLADVLSP